MGLERRAWLLSIGGLPLVVALAATTPVSLAPELQTQPGTPAAACSRAVDRAGTWRDLTHVTTAGSAPSFQVEVDPWEPCLLYRATSDQDLQRSTDSGRSWSPIFHDDAALGGPTPASGATTFSGRDLQVPGHRQLLLAEGGNGDAMVQSHDAGATWALADSGIEGQAISAVNTAPSDPAVLYATAAPKSVQGTLGAATFGTLDTSRPGGPFGIYVSRDAGHSWTFTTLPAAVSATGGDDWQMPPRNPQVQVDPDDPGHIWVMVEFETNVRASVQNAAILESTDFGHTWLPPNVPRVMAAGATQFLAVRSATHGLRLYLNQYASPGTSPPPIPVVSADDGRTWRDLSVQALGYASLAANPANPDLMIYGGFSNDNIARGGSSEIDYYVTYDSWDSATLGFPLGALRGPTQAHSPLKGGITDDPTVIMQADRYGSFYLLINQSCAEDFVSFGTAKGQKCFSDEPTAQYVAFFRQAFYRLTPVPPPPPHAGAAPSTQQPITPQGIEMAAIRTCTIPVVTRGGNDQSGALSFDGESLLYTHIAETGAAPYQGVVHRMDPNTCAERVPLTVSFNPKDLLQVASTDGFPDEAVHPYVDTLTYDANHDVLWISLRMASSDATRYPGALLGPNAAAIFSARITRAPGQSPTATAILRFFTPDQADFGEGADLLSYDFSDDTIWTTYPLDYANNGPNVGMAGHRSVDGVPIPSCLPTSAGYGDMATWVLAAPGHLYVQSENDQTILELDDHTCGLVQRYHHRNFGEPLGEDEQMACDSLTFGPTSAYSTGSPPTSVIWLRDAINQLAVAYAVPDSSCPFPTATRFLGQHEVVKGSVATLCASLERAGLMTPIAGLPLDFSVGGRYLGTATTGAGGVACVKALVTLGGGSYTVDASFAGTQQYRASHGAGPLTVDVSGIPGGALGLPAPFVPPPGLLPQPPGLTSNVSVPSLTGQTAAQGNAQPQPLSISQGQPVAASEPQTEPQHQLAISLQALGEQQENGQYAMVARPARARIPAAIASALGAIGFSLALAYGVRWSLSSAKEESYAEESRGKPRHRRMRR